MCKRININNKDIPFCIHGKMCRNGGKWICSVTWKRRQIKSNYGLSLEKWKSAILLPCEICGTIEKRKIIDHNHKTKQLRGTLCYRCNNTLGKSGDSIINFKRFIKDAYENISVYKGAIKYLEKYDG